MEQLQISGGDVVELKNGKIVEIADIKGDYIVVTCAEWYPKSEIIAIIKRFGDL